MSAGQQRPNDVDVNREVERLDNNVNGLFAKVSDLADRVDELEEQLEAEREAREQAEQLAQTALGVARAVDDGERADSGEPSKKKRAEHLSRDEVVRRALEDSGSGGGITAGEVKDMARPRAQLYHRTVRDAWVTLATKWQSLRVQERESDPDRLVVDVDDLEEDLVAIVDESLSRDDLSERLHRARS